MTGTCRAPACRAEIVFAKTAMGKNMPLNPERYDADDETANVAVYRDHTGQLVARVLRKGEQPERYEWRAMPHFATCVAMLAQRDKIPGVRSLDRARRGRRS
ncbi:MAG: hypothetical protein JWM93_3997 [Frankiales bacterium]|nr:hypothetical protein [Frankiales bacterium]